MKLIDAIKKLKLIEPDATFSETSKRGVLAHEPEKKSPFLFPGSTFVLRIVEAGIVAGLGAVFVYVLVTGGLNGSGLSPVPLSAINPKTLHAEAQAIDMQIQLANLAYQETTSSPMIAESTAAIAATGTATSSDNAASSTSATSTATSSAVSVDAALGALSQ